jgi:cell fate regulator YaaT (PSP1 superfamily)
VAAIEDYLLSYGRSGEFGCFRSIEPLTLRRGERVVARTPRGLEMAQVMRAAGPGHIRLLQKSLAGEILRIATQSDELSQADRRSQEQELFVDGRSLVARLELPLEILDCEILLDGKSGVLHYLRWSDCDPRQLMELLSDKYQLLVQLQELTQPEKEQIVDVGCGVEGCGKASGGCGSCQEGGCSTCASPVSTAADPVRRQLPTLP